MVGEYLIELLANFLLPRRDFHWPCRDLDTEGREVDVRDGTLHGSIQLQIGPEIGWIICPPDLNMLDFGS